jgi:hypothetical protein
MTAAVVRLVVEVAVVTIGVVGLFDVVTVLACLVVDAVIYVLSESLT